MSARKNADKSTGCPYWEFEVSARCNGNIVLRLSSPSDGTIPWPAAQAQFNTVLDEARASFERHLAEYVAAMFSKDSAP
ncbi:hypothetical protein [Gluconobacter oxydans]|uniref:hypothetical protein n=1 Tax=Gluconobacter oxydans TaxID=442 RepID=UPI001559F720|nr:hypothetical protein [Gluconobacter oxydans]